MCAEAGTDFGAAVISVVQGALGKFASFQSLTGNQRGTVDIVDPVTREILEPAVAKDTADHITLHGILESGALSAVFVRAGPQFDPAAPAMRWNIYGSKGEIEITSPTIFINMSIVTQVRVRIGDGPIEAVKVEDGGDQGKAANVRRVYESFYKGGEGARHATFEDALEDHRFLEEIYGGRLGEKVVYSSKNV